MLIKQCPKSKVAMNTVKSLELYFVIIDLLDIIADLIFMERYNKAINLLV